MKGGAALALAGLIFLAMGLKGTYKDVYAALLGQYHGVTSGATNYNGSPVGGVPTAAGKVIGCTSTDPNGADIPVPPSGICPGGYDPVYASTGGGGNFGVIPAYYRGPAWYHGPFRQNGNV